MAIDFPDSPSNGQAFTSNNKTWVFDGTSWNITSGTNSVADGAITTAKVADNAITTAKVAANAITQAKLSASLSAVTVTTSANRNAAVPSPFTGQLVFLTDTKKMQVWDGSAWLNITLAPPEPPTSLSATALGNTSFAVSFTAGGANGSPITNYKYALSTNGGSSYGSFTLLDPADVSSPITISGLAQGTTYHVKLKAVNDMGDSAESSATSTTTLVVPDAPTNLSASNITATTVDISFTAGADNGYAITNYQYALSTNGGSTYGSFTALNPADASSPITITGLTHGTTYYVKLKAVNSGGAGPESSAVSFIILDGLAEATAGTSAYQLKTLYPAYTTGYFWIKPTGGSVARQVWCDMSNLGGGWMLMSYCGTSVSTGTHVKDAYTGSAFDASSSTVAASNGGSGTAGNLGQSFIDSCVVAARSKGVALFRVNNTNWYFPTTSTSNWLVLSQRSRADHANLSTFDTTNMARTGNAWLKSCYPTYTADSGNNFAGTVSGAIVQMSEEKWNTFPGNMTNGSTTNWGYSISPYYNQTSETQNEGNYVTWPSSHSDGWSRSAYFWLKIGAE